MIWIIGTIGIMIIGILVSHGVKWLIEETRYETELERRPVVVYNSDRMEEQYTDEYMERVTAQSGLMEAYRVVDRVIRTGEVLEQVIYQKLLDMSYEDMMNGAMERL